MLQMECIMSNQNFLPHNNTSQSQQEARQQLHKLFDMRPFDDATLLTNFGLFARSSALAKIFFLHEIYNEILTVPGDIYVLGTWLGQDLVVFESMRAMLEPYNASRAFVGFDTFDGYEGITDLDKRSETVKGDGYAVPDNYKDYLAQLLAYHRSENAMGHAVEHNLVQGDACNTVATYMDEHPEAFVALAYFDMALYEPTKAALEAMEERLLSGSLLVFDELNDARYPGESKAVREWLKGKRYTIRRSRFLPDRSLVTLS
ncbi:Macrocin-O-methyltransferase (TylF) [Roseovarius nanhaiticus]|uniref:Macrocin-O-methyltransferase (TylF) n=2 Tax=Roseovarius nanhaiticus TaxID=573024 RepID=A0A1N7F2W6_9RHOB|nr:Macrocin-O-methyltransferase (TylF) [Roseovarius nanhaiticus]SIR94688.1 Macrocin-O-methyltransferase (TylF) [Roseovarius nanhaiticus]